MRWALRRQKEFGEYYKRFAYVPRRTRDGWIWLETYWHKWVLEGDDWQWSSCDWDRLYLERYKDY